MKKITAIVYDGGFKDSAPALQSLKNQTILNDVQVIWIEYYNKIFPPVKDYKFITTITLNLQGPKSGPTKNYPDMSYCYNAGLSIAEGEYFILVDPCLWFPPNTLENIYKFHKEHPQVFTFNHEMRGKNTNNRHILTNQYFKDISKFKGDIVKVKKTNRGCMSCTRTEYYKGVDGFDSYPVVLFNHLTLCLIRMKNKYHLKEVGLPQRVYHPFHPRTQKTTKEQGTKILNEYKTNKTVAARGGLSGFNIVHKLEGSGNSLSRKS